MRGEPANQLSHSVGNIRPQENPDCYHGRKGAGRKIRSTGEALDTVLHRLVARTEAAVESQTAASLARRAESEARPWASFCTGKQSRISDGQVGLPPSAFK
jgi:hypothetical protein